MKIRFSRRFAFLLLTLVLLAYFCQEMTAQEQCVVDGISITSKTGIVRLSNGTSIENVLIRFSKDVKGRRSVLDLQSGSDGNFVFESLKPGKYYLTVSYENLVPLTTVVFIKGKSLGGPLTRMNVTMALSGSGDCSFAGPQIISK